MKQSDIEKAKQLETAQTTIQDLREKVCIYVVIWTWVYGSLGKDIADYQCTNLLLDHAGNIIYLYYLLFKSSGKNLGLEYLEYSAVSKYFEDVQNFFHYIYAILHIG